MNLKEILDIGESNLHIDLDDIARARERHAWLPFKRAKATLDKAREIDCIRMERDSKPPQPLFSEPPIPSLSPEEWSNLCEIEMLSDRISEIRNKITSEEEFEEFMKKL